jgi:hypothetical protein
MTTPEYDFKSVNNFSITEIQISASAVPIPPALWLFGSGLLGLIGMARKKRKIIQNNGC